MVCIMLVVFIFESSFCFFGILLSEMKNRKTSIISNGCFVADYHHLIHFDNSAKI